MKKERKVVRGKLGGPEYEFVVHKKGRVTINETIHKFGGTFVIKHTFPYFRLAESWYAKQMGEESPTEAAIERLVADQQVVQTVYPCVVMPARYGGTYEGGRWLAFHCETDQIPEAAFGDDITCVEFWSDPAPRRIKRFGTWMDLLIGKGDTPNDAIVALHKLVTENGK